MIQLPPAFITEMHDLFAENGMLEQWPDFSASFQGQSAGGVRANTLKIPAADLRQLLSESSGAALETLRPIPWTSDGFYLPPDCQPGKLPWHSAGLYYVQEPSAMLPAAVLDARPGEKILDLCAAPGGKSCRIAADLHGKGLLWANEISAERVRALLHNIELMGCENCLITQESPERLAERLPGYFDKILVDAPCSGSGMFRRDPGAIGSWQSYGSASCTVLQRDILAAAWKMLRPGGYLVYSTCTFSKSENEEMISWFIAQTPDAVVSPIGLRPGVSEGFLPGTVRIWPHLSAGDGHFCALLQKSGDQPQNAGPAAIQQQVSSGSPAWQAFDRFCQDTLSDLGWQRLQKLRAESGHRHERDCLHLLPQGLPVPDGLKKVKTGLFLGQIKTLRDKTVLFEPSQAWLLSLKADDLRYCLQGVATSDLIRRYLRGETLTLADDQPVLPRGVYAGVCLKSRQGAWPLGWVKAMDGRLMKNLYPQAWRRLI